MQSQLDIYEEMERQYEDARTRLQGLKQELSAYERIMALLAQHINDNLIVQKRLDTNNEEERKQAIVKEAYNKLVAKYERFKVAKMDREDDYKKVFNDKNRIEIGLNSMKAQIASIKKLQDTQEDQMNKLQRQGQDTAFDYDVETINFLNDSHWNLGESCDRSLAETLLSCFPNGTFLVRSSKTKPNSYVLSVVINANVRHCLIDKIEEEYCFHPPGPTHQMYPNLCDLVMDYRHKSLVCHNSELDTNLIYPILSQLKKTSKNASSGARQFVNN